MKAEIRLGKLGLLLPHASGILVHRNDARRRVVVGRFSISIVVFPSSSCCCADGITSHMQEVSLLLSEFRYCLHRSGGSPTPEESPCPASPAYTEPKSMKSRSEMSIFPMATRRSYTIFSFTMRGRNGDGPGRRVRRGDDHRHICCFASWTWVLGRITIGARISARSGRRSSTACSASSSRMSTCSTTPS